MVKHKPFTKTEMKILVYNKVKRGMSYHNACEELQNEINKIIENDIKFEKIIRKENKKMDKKKFKEEFKKLKNG